MTQRWQDILPVITRHVVKRMSWTPRETKATLSKLACTPIFGFCFEGRPVTMSGPDDVMTHLTDLHIKAWRRNKQVNRFQQCRLHWIDGVNMKREKNKYLSNYGHFWRRRHLFDEEEQAPRPLSFSSRHFQNGLSRSTRWNGSAKRR